jgi:hypothetical protein
MSTVESHILIMANTHGGGGGPPRIDRGVVVEAELNGTDYWIALVGKSHSAVFHSTRRVGQHNSPQSLNDEFLPAAVVERLANPMAGAPPLVTGSWWVWLEQPGSDRCYPVKFTYTPPTVNPDRDPVLTWTNYDFSLGVKRCMVTLAAEAGEPPWTTLLVQLRGGNTGEPIVLAQRAGQAWTQPVPHELRGRLVATRSQWDRRLEGVVYVRNRDGLSPPQVPSDSGQPTTPGAIFAEIVIIVIIAALAWVSYCLLHDEYSVGDAELDCLLAAAIIASAWAVIRGVFLIGMRYWFNLPCDRLVLRGLILYMCALCITVSVTALIGVSLGLQRPLNADAGVVVTSILFGFSAGYTLYNVVAFGQQLAKCDVPFDTTIDSDDDEPDNHTAHRIGFSACTEIVLGIFSVIAFALCVASLVLFFVALEHEALTIPALTNITAAVLDDTTGFAGGDIIDNGAALQLGLFFLFGAITTLTHAVVAFIAAVDSGSHSPRANWRTAMFDSVLSMRTTIGSANTVVVFNLPLVMTNLITIVAKRRLFDVKEAYPIIAALWAVMLAALLFHYVSMTAYDIRVTTAAAAKVRSRVGRCLRKLQRHVASHSLQIDGRRADSQNLKRAYDDVNMISAELRVYSSPVDVASFRGKIDLLQTALDDYGKALSVLQHTPGNENAGDGFARGALAEAINSTLTQVHVANQAVNRAAAAANAANVNASPADLTAAANALVAACEMVTVLLRAANAEQTAPAVHAAQVNMTASVATFAAGVRGQSFDGSAVYVHAQATLRDAVAVRDATGLCGYTLADLTTASRWVSHAVRYADELKTESPQTMKRDETGSSSTTGASATV